MTTAYLRSDNAGCYHNVHLLLSLREVGVRTGVRPVRYDFSEPQAGKDICDRKTAAMKAQIKRWVNESSTRIPWWYQRVQSSGRRGGQDPGEKQR